MNTKERLKRIDLKLELIIKHLKIGSNQKKGLQKSKSAKKPKDSKGNPKTKQRA
jgi:hypothetical protein